MSGGNTTSEIGGGLLTAGLIAATVMSDGAAAPALEGELAAEGVGGAATTDAGLGLVDASGNIIGGGAAGSSLGSGLAGEGIAGTGITGSGLMQTGAGINALNTANNMLSPAELQAWNQGQADSFVQNPNAYAPVASTGATPLVPTNAASSVPNVDAANAQLGQNIQNQADVGAPVSAPPVTPSYQMNPITGQPMTADQIAGEGSTATGGNGIAGGGNGATPWYQNYWNNLTDTSGKGLNLAQKATLGGAGIATLLALQKSGAMQPNYLTPYQPKTAGSMGLGATMSPNYQPLRAQNYATGGNVASPTPAVTTPADVMPADLQNQQAAVPSQLQALMSQYGVTPQQASQGIQSLMGSQQKPTAGPSFANGGVASLREGSFVVPADVVSHFGNGSTDAGLDTLQRHFGASPIRGHGDGMSDDIPTNIDGKQEARVANGEAVIHPEKVKQIGKGSADAGAKKLYAMMDKVRKARTGHTKQGKQIKAEKYLPA